MQWLPPVLEHMGGETREGGGGVQYFTALRGGGKEGECGKSL